jgi:hypothetical protein
MSVETRVCPSRSVETLNAAIQAAEYPKADISALAKRLLEGESFPPAEADDAPGLKVEKNALAVVFIRPIATIAEEFIEAHPGRVFNMLLGKLGSIPVADARKMVDPANPQATACAIVTQSLSALFQHLTLGYVLALADAARNGEEEAAWTHDTLLGRYQRALTDYHGHTAEKDTHFTPHGHIMAGINTALFFILRAMSAICVLGERRLGRPLTRDELAQGVRDTTPLLLTIARCHLDQLLELEGPLGKHGDDPAMLRLGAADYADRLAAMFAPTDGFGVDFAPGVLESLPALGGVKPRTGCPALYAATLAEPPVNSIVSLIRLCEKAFAELLFTP